MFPWYHGYRGDGDLPEDDRLAIQTLYGVRDGAKQWGPNPRRHHFTQPTTTTTTTTTTYRPTTRRYNTQRYYPDQPRRTVNEHPTRYPDRPRYYPAETTTTSRTTTTTAAATTKRHHHYSTNHHHHQQNHHNHNNNNNNNHNDEKPVTCNTSYDAITMIRGEIFVFKGRYMWRIGNNGLSDGYPHEITKMWRSLPHNLTHIDTVYENKRHQIVFFIGESQFVN